MLRLMTTISLAEHFAAPGPHQLPVLEREVADLMTPGVVSIAENAPVRRVFQAFAAHPVHAILVTGSNSGSPLGWITVHGLLAWMDAPLTRPARDAITEEAVSVRGSVPAKTALSMMLAENVGRLLVHRGKSGPPEGVVSERDLVVARGHQ